MKKIISCVILLALLFSVSPVGSADIDLSGMSYEELVALKDRINLAMWESDEWEEVAVPQGIWHVGEDIPAGRWTIAAADGAYPKIKVGSSIDSNGKLERADIAYESLKSPTRSTFKENEDKPSVNLDLAEGVYVSIEGGTVVFTPYQGKPSLGFKKSDSPSSDEVDISVSRDLDAELTTEADILIEDILNAVGDSSAAAGIPVESGQATAGEINALSSAKTYLAYTAFSYKGLVQQLEYEGFSTAEATYAVDHCGADWMEQACKSAKNYLAYTAFSYTGLVSQLEYEGFSDREATYAVDHCGADWMEQAFQSAKNYLSYSSFSKSGLIQQLEFEGFTHDQAAYGAEKAYQ